MLFINEKENAVLEMPDSDDEKYLADMRKQGWLSDSRVNVDRFLEDAHVLNEELTREANHLKAVELESGVADFVAQGWSDDQIKLVAGLDDEVLNDLKGKKLSKQFENKEKI